MNNNFMHDYAEMVGGQFTLSEISALPFNHWRKDYEWLVMILDGASIIGFIPVQALTAREACATAIDHYLNGDADE